MSVRHRRGVLAALTAGMGILAGCGGGSDSNGGGTVYRGRFAQGFEMSSFVPCDGEEDWWAVGNLQPITREAPYDYSPVYVEVTGAVTEPGRYGHLGAYDRELNIREVRLVQREVPDACR